jgi:hypothetical protein
MLTGKRLVLCKEAKISVRLHNSAHAFIYARTGIEVFPFWKKKKKKKKNYNIVLPRYSYYKLIASLDIFELSSMRRKKQ